MKFKKKDIIRSKKGTEFKVISLFNKDDPETMGYILKPVDPFMKKIIDIEHNCHNGFWIKKIIVERNCELVK